MHAAQGIEQTAPGLWRSILAAAAGNVLEWYDFTVYAYMAPYIAAKFFPGDDPVAGLLAVFATFGLGFVIRPLGGILIGRFGDLKGRKAALLLTIVLMAVGTAGIGLVPGRAAIGGLAPWLLVFCRLLQGFSAGGEWGSSTAFIYEWAPKGRRGFFSSLQQSSVAGGMLLGSAVAALFGTLLSKTQMADFGWRIPFLLGALIIPIGFYMWRYVEETPVFAARESEKVNLRAGVRLAAQASGIIVIWTVAYYAILTYMPVFTARYSHLGPAAALWSNALSLFVLAVTIPAFGLLGGPDRAQAPAADRRGRLCASVLSAVPADREQRGRACRRSGADRLRADDGDLFRRRAGGGDGDFSVRLAAALDVHRLQPDRGAVRRLRALHFDLAGQDHRLASIAGDLYRRLRLPVAGGDPAA